MDITNGLPNNVKQAREELRVSQIELTYKSGVPQSTLSRLERGLLEEISLTNARAIARVLGRTVDELFPDPALEFEERSA